jgi:hypothetical protein
MASQEEATAHPSVSHSAAAPSVLDQDAPKSMDTSEALPGSDAPDGGVVAWLVILGAWCISFCSFGWLNSKAGS